MFRWLRYFLSFMPQATGGNPDTSELFFGWTLERLEARRMLTTGIYFDSGLGHVHVQGSDLGDSVEITVVANDQVRVALSYANVTNAKFFDRTAVGQISFNGGPGDDQFYNRTAIACVVFGNAGSDLLVGGDDDDLLDGGDNDDRLDGAAGNDMLRGGEGKDTMVGGIGKDDLIGGPGDDLLTGREDADTLVGEAGADRLFGDSGDDIFDGGDGNDWLIGGAGADTIQGGKHDDILLGESGNDNLLGGEGLDYLDGGVDDDLLAGSDGTDQLYGGSGNDGLDGGLGDDYLVGGPDNDHLIGGRGDDWLLGGDGQDILLGALGSDRLEGGAGNDRLLGDPQDASLLPGAGTNIVNPNYASILGLAIDPANNPNSTSDDAVRALLETTALTDKVTIFHDFVTDDLLDNKLTTLQFLHDQGIKTFVQLSVQFLGEPNPPGGLPKTFADPQVRQAYLDLVQEFAEVQPHRINLGAEINFLEFFRPAEFANFASLYQEAYYLVKSISPSTQVGVSMHLAAFRGLEQINILDTLGPRDYVGFTSYPIWLVDEGLLNLPTEIPASYHTWLRDQLPNEIIVLSELAWPHSSGTDEQGQRDFVARLPEMMSGLQPAEIYWPIAHDVSFFGRGLLTPEALDFLNQYNVDIDELFDRLNNMGLRHVQGMPYASWFEAMTLDFGNHNPGLTLPVGQNGRGDTLQEPKRLVEPTLVPTLPPIITSVGSDALDFATSAKEKESPTSDRNAAQLSIMMIGPTTDWRRDLTNIKFNFKANQYGHESLLAWLVDWQSTHGLGDLPEST